MFAPRPQTHQISRHYSSQTTSKKNQDKENSNALPSKTPSRAGIGKMLAPNTAAASRVGLGPGNPKGGTIGQDGGKGKGKEVDDIGPKRLFTSNSTIGLSSSKSFGSLQAKTPARGSKQQQGRTPGPLKASIMGLPPLSHTPLPSASKPRRSSRRSISISLTPAAGQPILESKPQQQFATPAPKNRQWDEGDLMGSISEGLNELAISGGLGEVVEEEDDGEPESMPPRGIPLPWEPIGAVPSIESEAGIIAQFPPLWSMIPSLENMPALPELELGYGIESHPTQQGDDDLEEPFFRDLKLAAAAATAKQAAPRRQPLHARFASTSTNTSKAVAPSRVIRPGHVRPTAPPLPKSSLSMNPNGRITKPPVPRLGARSAVPAVPRLEARSTAQAAPRTKLGSIGSARPAPTPISNVPSTIHSRETEDLIHEEPILAQDEDFGFSDTDFDALQTP